MPQTLPACRLISAAYGTTVSHLWFLSRIATDINRHNMPSAEASAFRSQYRHSSISDVSRSPRGSFSASGMGQPGTATASSLPQPSGTMSIGSIIEPNMRSDFKSEFSSHAGPSIHELPHGPIGTAPRSLHPELLYGLAPSGDSPLYSSSDSCYSPLSGISDYLQPPAVTQPFYAPDMIQRPQSTSIENCFQPIIQSPMSAGPPTPAWNQQYDPTALGFAPEVQCLPPVSDCYEHSSCAKANTLALATSIPISLSLMGRCEWITYLRIERSLTTVLVRPIHRSTQSRRQPLCDHPMTTFYDALLSNFYIARP